MVFTVQCERPIADGTVKITEIRAWLCEEEEENARCVCESVMSTRGRCVGDEWGLP